MPVGGELLDMSDWPLWELRLVPRHRSGHHLALPSLSVRQAVRDYPEAALRLYKALDEELHKVGASVLPPKT